VLSSSLLHLPLRWFVVSEEEEERRRQRRVEVHTPAEVVVVPVVAGAVGEGLVGGERFEVGRMGKGVDSGG
jgi:hypothetical protein